jgi:hypothetical protein
MTMLAHFHMIVNWAICAANNSWKIATRIKELVNRKYIKRTAKRLDANAISIALCGCIGIVDGTMLCTITGGTYDDNATKG